MGKWPWAGAAFVASVGMLALAGWLPLDRFLSSPLADLPQEAPQDGVAGKDQPQHMDRQLAAAPAIASAIQVQADPAQEALAAGFRRVADQYEEDARFPPYSIPLAKGQAESFRYNRYSPIELPLTSDAGEVRLRIMLDQLQFQQGEPIVGVLSVSGEAAAQVRMQSVQLITSENAILYDQPLTLPDNQEARAAFSIPLVLTPSAAQAKDWPMDLLLRAEGRLGAQPVAIVAPVLYAPAIGEVKQVESASVEGEHLMIPVELALQGEGAYALSGNLYGRDKTPLVHLESEAELSKFDNRIQLKVHWSALQAKGDAGPYLLGDLALRKLPEEPGDQTLYGNTSDQTYPVAGFPFNRYEQRPYQDPLREARLEFLRTPAKQL